MTNERGLAGFPLGLPLLVHVLTVVVARNIRPLI